MRGSLWCFVSIVVVLVLTAGSAPALDIDHRQKGEGALDGGIAYLRKTQNVDGSWSPRAGPAITAMIMSAMLDRPNIAFDDPAVDKALAYILSKVKEDGGIHDGILQNYNTAICLAALAKVKGRTDTAAAIGPAQRFLRQLQWHDQLDPNGEKISPTHPFYGGAGYGKHGRPDLSNTQVMLQAMHDSGLSSDDPVFQRAMVFVTRCQGTTANTDFADKIAPDGGFIYATSKDKQHIGQPQSMADSQQPDHEHASRLRTYGSMTYAGFKSYVYANLKRDDPRVVNAHAWICRNYTVDHNPGLPENRKLQGYYYYLMTMSRALDAWGQTHIATADNAEHDWANDLVEKLVELQRDDGSWINESSRWMEADANLVTAYALIALTHAIN